MAAVRGFADKRTVFQESQIYLFNDNTFIYPQSYVFSTVTNFHCHWVPLDRGTHVTAGLAHSSQESYSVILMKIVRVAKTKLFSNTLHLENYSIQNVLDTTCWKSPYLVTFFGTRWEPRGSADGTCAELEPMIERQRLGGRTETNTHTPWHKYDIAMINPNMDRRRDKPELPTSERRLRSWKKTIVVSRHKFPYLQK